MSIFGIEDDESEYAEPMSQFCYKLETPTAIAPLKSSLDDAGFDLFLDEEFYLSHLESKKASTGVSFRIPKGYFLDIRSRSSTFSKFGAILSNCVGTIDHGYTGIIYIELIRLVPGVKHYKKGDKICQAILRKDHSLSFKLEELSGDHYKTGRGAKGFGSTGSNHQEFSKPWRYDIDPIPLKQRHLEMTRGNGIK